MQSNSGLYNAVQYNVWTSIRQGTPVGQAAKSSVWFPSCRMCSDRRRSVQSIVSLFNLYLACMLGSDATKIRYIR